MNGLTGPDSTSSSRSTRKTDIFVLNFQGLKIFFASMLQFQMFGLNYFLSHIYHQDINVITIHPLLPGCASVNRRKNDSIVANSPTFCEVGKATAVKVKLTGTSAWV